MQNEGMENLTSRIQLETKLTEFSRMFRRFHILKMLLFTLIYLTFIFLIIYPIYIIFYPSTLFIEIFWSSAFVLGIVFGVRILRSNFKFAKSMSLEEKAVLVESKFEDHNNLLVNSLQITDRFSENNTFQASIAQKITDDASEYIKSKSPEFKTKISWHVVKKLSLVFLVLCILLASTFAFAGSHVVNAMKHFFTLGYLLDDFAISIRMTETLGWELTPNDDIEVIKGDDLLINATPDGISDSVNAFVYDTISKDSENKHTMNFNGNTFSFTYKNIQSDFRYFIASGHERTKIINVKVVELPAIEMLSLRIKYPEYTRKPDDVINDFQGDIIALKGAKVTLHLKSTQPLKKAETLLIDEKKTLSFRQSQSNSKEFALDFTILQNDSFRIRLTNEKDRIYETEKDRKIRILPDLLPQIKILTPSQNSIQQALNSSLSISLRVFDDFGINQIKMLNEHNDNLTERILFNNFDSKNVNQQMSSKFNVEFPSSEYNVGDKIFLYFQASDYNPERSENEKYSKSRIIEINLIEQEQSEVAKDKLLEDVIMRLNLLLNKQRLTKGETEKVAKWIKRGRDNKLKDTINSIDIAQKEIRKEMLDIAAITNVEEFPSKDTPKILEELAGGVAYEIINLLSEITETLELPKDTASFERVITWQDEIIETILKLLETLKNKENLEDDLSKNKENLDLSRKVQEKLENLKSKLDEFKKDQKRIIELTKELGRKAEEDWTEEDDKIWEECKQAEDDWAKFFEDTRNDLSKLPDQDFSCSEVTDELNQIYQEVRNASDEVVKKNITIAVTREEAGLEIAEELENNLERWLSDTRDYIKWEMEEPTEDYDVPLSDLPDELEDIIGDLIDEEEDITDEVDDVSSSWMDNLDKGAGWDAMDGPISNMSAKGVTGNQMPNSSEIGGRSGEGRTGRSSGQFVSKEATGGRGGRKTPTRDDGTAPETGQVKDKSNDEVGGATGGGKLSGDGGQGVRGESFPELKETMRRLQGKQADVLNRAEKLKRELEKRRYPTEILDKTIEMMRLVDSELKDFSQHTPGDVKDRIMKIVTQLKQADTSVKDAAKLYQDLTRAMPKEVRDQVTSAQDEKSPEKYKDLLDNYYRQLLKSK